MNNNAQDEQPTPTAAGSLAQRVVELSELQIQLLRADLRSSAKHFRAGMVALLGAAIGLLAVTPVLLLAFSGWLQSSTSLSLPASQLLVSAVTIAVGLLVAYAGWRSLRQASSQFGRSTDEWRRNLGWAKKVLVQDEKAKTPNSQRHVAHEMPKVAPRANRASSE